MSAFFVANVKIKDPQKFQEYAKKAGETFATYGGEPVLRGKVEEILAGSAEHQAVGIVKFPDLEALSTWFNSDAYQAIVPLREEASEMVIVSYTVPV